MASTKLTMSNSGAGDSRKKMTWSFWIKRSKLGVTQYLYNQYYSSDQYNSGILFQSDDSIRFWDYAGSSNDIDLQTTRLFRDVNAWYHIVLAIDTTQGTAANRVKLYVNGVQETVFDVATYPSQDHQLRMGEGGSSHQQQIGFQGFGSTYQSYFDGVMSHVHYIDGYTYAASDFGSTDANGVWKIKTSPSVTYGTNGFFILKDGNSVTDQSGNGNNFTVAGGTLTKTEDCPSNVFATWNPLDGLYQGGTGSNGNTTWQTNNSLYSYRPATLGASSGKFYWEVKYVAKSGGNDYPLIGITSTQTAASKGVGDYPNDWGWYIAGSTSYLRNNSSNTSWGNAYTVGDIVGVALDCDNNKLYLSKNGVFQESGNPSSGSNGVSITAPSSTPLGLYFPAFTYYDGTYNGTFSANFGNGYFGTTAVSSAGTNASGIGIFEYDVPNGYTSLSTKGLNL